MLLLVAALEFFPWLPRSRTGWLVFLIAAPPLYLFGEWLGERFWEPWWEGSILGTIAKVTLIIVLALIAIMIQVIRMP